MSTIINKKAAGRFNVRHIPWIEVAKIGDGFQAKVFDPAWGEVWKSGIGGSQQVVVALAKDVCRKTCGDAIPNVFTV